MVVNGDYELAEGLLHKAVDKGLFGPYIHQQDYVPQWMRILPCVDQDPCQRPGMRGGHQVASWSTAWYETIHCYSLLYTRAFEFYIKNAFEVKAFDPQRKIKQIMISE